MCKYGSESKDGSAPDPVIYQGQLTGLYNDLKKAGADPIQALREKSGGLQQSDDLKDVLGQPKNLVPIWAANLDSFCRGSRDSEKVPEIGTDVVRAAAFNYLIDRKWDALCRCRQPPKQGGCPNVVYIVETENQLGTILQWGLYGALGSVGWELMGSPFPSDYYRFAINGFYPPGTPVKISVAQQIPRPQFENDGNFIRVKRIFRPDGLPDNCAIDDSLPPEIPRAVVPLPIPYYFAPAGSLLLPDPYAIQPGNPVLTPPSPVAPSTGKPTPPCTCPTVKPPMVPQPREIERIVEVQGLPGKPGKDGVRGEKGLPGEKGKDAMVEFSKIPIPILDCLDPGAAEVVETVIDVVSGSLGSEAALIGQLFNQILKIRQEQCGGEVGNATAEMVASGVTTATTQVTFVAIENQDARMFALRLVPPFPDNVRLYQIQEPFATEGDYGSCGVCYAIPGTDGYANYGSRLNVATPGTLIPVPVTGLNAFIRISLKTGLEWQLWDLGVRAKKAALPGG